MSSFVLQIQLPSNLGNSQWTLACRMTVYVPVSGDPYIVRIDRDE